MKNTIEALVKYDKVLARLDFAWDLERGGHINIDGLVRREIFETNEVRYAFWLDTKPVNSVTYCFSCSIQTIRDACKKA